MSCQPMLFSKAVILFLAPESLPHTSIVGWPPLAGSTITSQFTISHKDFNRDGADFLKTFQEYYGRLLTAKEYLAQKAGAKPE